MSIEFKIDGLEVLKAKLKKASEKARRSVGFEALEEIKSKIDVGIPPALSEMGKKISGNKTGKPLENIKSFLRLTSRGDKVTVGYLNKGGDVEPFFLKIGKNIEFGRKTAVTPKMRRYLGFKGFPIKKSTDVLNVPERPILGMMSTFISENGGKSYKKKFLEKMNKD